MWTYTDIDVLVEATNDIRVNTTVFAEADLIILNPTDWNHIKRLKSTLGTFLLAGVNGPNEIGNATRGYNSLFGTPVQVTTQIAQGTACVLDTELAAEVIWRWGLELLWNYWGDSQFQYNKVQLRGEERVGLTVPFPDAIVKVTGLGQGYGWGS